ncbi:hypothetical protein SAMN05428964_11220 [Thalassospira xiamenensis]|uniref:Uncharacterized protein n=1 Tax=Thalassospira xiamenensis TaxID=220697 RepID=A0A285TYN0_9PROT|nr:hypothetical protein SAMN05428964_11220 [Thalassospira xiamenensis]
MARFDLKIKNGGGWKLTRRRKLEFTPLEIYSVACFLLRSGRRLHDSRMIYCFLNWSKPPLAIGAYEGLWQCAYPSGNRGSRHLPVISTKANVRKPIAHDAGLTPDAILLSVSSAI